MNHLKRFPRYKQQNASDCGPTSLRTIALSPIEPNFDLFGTRSRQIAHLLLL